MAGLEAAYRDRRVFVTGHTGFKGAWLVLWLSALGARITGVSLPESVSEPNLFELAHLDAVCRDLRFDVRDGVRLAEAIEEAQPDLIFHLAAQSLVRRGYADPVGTFATNAIGTANLLSAVRGRSMSGVIVVTSDKVYRNEELGRPFCETDPLGGFDPYSASKAAAEAAVDGFRALTGMPPLVCARAGNVIGGGDWSEDRLVPDIARTIAADGRLVLRNPFAVRPWQHVLDCLSGYLECGRRTLAGEKTPGAVNFGPDPAGSASVKDLSLRILAGWRPDTEVVYETAKGPPEAKTLRLDTALAREALGWLPSLALAPTIDWTVEWYRRHAAGENVRDICGEQINAYTSRQKPTG